MPTNTLEKRRANRKAAMPEVEKIVRRFGIGTINGCLTKIRERNRTRKNIDKLKSELARLQRAV